MKRRHLYALLQVTLLLVAGWLVWRSLAPKLAHVGVAEFVRWRPALWPLAISTVGLTLLHLSQAFLWRRVAVDMGAPRPDARTTVRVYFVSGLARFIPGSLWQFAGMAVLGQQAGIPPLTAAAAGVIGNIAFVATGVVFLIFTRPGQPGALGLLVGVLVAAAATVAVFAFTGTRGGERARNWIAARAPARLLPALEFAGRIRPRQALAWTAGYGACWLLLGASFVVFVDAFVPGSLAHWRELAGTMAAAYLGGFLVPFAPAGLGARELAMAAILSGIVPAPAAVVFPVAQRLWFFAAELIALGTFPLFPHRDREPDSGDRGRGTERTLKEIP